MRRRVIWNFSYHIYWNLLPCLYSFILFKWNCSEISHHPSNQKLYHLTTQNDNIGEVDPTVINWDIPPWMIFVYKKKVQILALLHLNHHSVITKSTHALNSSFVYFPNVLILISTRLWNLRHMIWCLFEVYYVQVSWLWVALTIGWKKYRAYIELDSKRNSEPHIMM
jgi:hypothetical protein